MGDSSHKLCTHLGKAVLHSLGSKVYVLVRSVSCGISARPTLSYLPLVRASERVEEAGYNCRE